MAVVRRRGPSLRHGQGTQDQDALATRAASRSIGWQIMLASAVLVLGIVVIAIVFLLHQAQPREQIDNDHSTGPHVYVDSTDVLQALVILGIGAVVFAGLVSWIIARRAVKPLGTALRLQHQFVADASHELRTPLAVLDARLQVLERRLGAVSPPDRDATMATVAELRADSKALVDIVNDLLLAAGGPVTTSGAVEALPIVEEAVASLTILSSERGVTLDFEAQDATRLSVPPTSLRRCVIALVDNAIGHSPRGGTVRITAGAHGPRFVLSVADEGPGITGIEPNRVFERFAHSDPSMTADDEPGSALPMRPSFGIGLALVKDIADRQGGNVRVDSTSTEGTTMVLELPVARA
ncbi:hypothetical protein AX769_15195 [Frondihabitans sp. PAMC 28766]|uniref:sensor histidine kinase n=1 Tax=Frondihabitans sp. PAMC 28766 TaxID=1795630 RepID=UPI00078C4D6B|nr:HAMP domain-containing sensor histidine kinase [Frondihabitans sp. PAMC 28766]AMM21234.1 hypothetical protein AX769_15195 [Frondihabitans sp. PAMC 28766]